MRSKANRAHQVLMRAWQECIGEYAADMPAEEILGVAAQFVGQLVAVQDARRDPGAIMQMVANNIEIGNAAAIGSVLNRQTKQ